MFISSQNLTDYMGYGNENGIWFEKIDTDAIVICEFCGSDFLAILLYCKICYEWHIE